MWMWPSRWTLRLISAALNDEYGLPSRAGSGGLVGPADFPVCREAGHPGQSEGALRLETVAPERAESAPQGRGRAGEIPP